VTDLHLMGYSLLTEDVMDLGPVPDDLDELLQLGEFAATGHDNLIVFTQGPEIPTWKDATL
jgi:hypothetical protein